MSSLRAALLPVGPLGARGVVLVGGHLGAHGKLLGVWPRRALKRDRAALRRLRLPGAASGEAAGELGRAARERGAQRPRDVDRLGDRRVPGRVTGLVLGLEFRLCGFRVWVGVNAESLNRGRGRVLGVDGGGVQWDAAADERLLHHNPQRAQHDEQEQHVPQAREVLRRQRTVRCALRRAASARQVQEL